MSEELVSLRVKGNMYADALISDGDIVVMKKQSTAEIGDLVVVWRKVEGEMVIKRYYRAADDMTMLASCTPAMRDMYEFDKDIEIHGKVIVVIRQLEKA